MHIVNKILFPVLALSYMAIVTNVVYAQDKFIPTKHKSKITLGFDAGKQISFNRTNHPLSTTNKLPKANSGTFILRKAFSPRFTFETGLTYYSYQNNLPPVGEVLSKHSKAKQLSKLSVPVTIQYYFLPEQYKIRPFCGTGLLYDCNPKSADQSPMDTHSGNYNNADTKYISILFTQGVTFEINTKIQIRQSFHFIPGNASKTIGIDLGIGYTFP